MKFLCAKVKDFWLTSPQNTERVRNAGLTIRGSFIGIEVGDTDPSTEECNLINNAIENLFGENKKAFPLRLVEI